MLFAPRKGTFIRLIQIHRGRNVSSYMIPESYQSGLSVRSPLLGLISMNPKLVFAEETRKRFGDIDTTGPVSGSISPRIKAFKNGLKFYYIKPGHIVVPGLAGKQNTVCCIGVSHRNERADAHAHLLEQGFMRNLPVDNTSSISGKQPKTFLTLNLPA